MCQKTLCPTNEFEHPSCALITCVARQMAVLEIHCPIRRSLEAYCILLICVARQGRARNPVSY